MAEIRLVPCLSDNYAVLMHDDASGTTLLVDAPEPAPIDKALDETGWALTHILLTHKHADHLQGVGALKARGGVTVLGPAEASQAGLDTTLADGQTFTVGPWSIEAMATPGHTSAPLSYYVESEKVAFTGDTLFAMGCGRLFEGDPATMWASLSKLRARCPDDTRIYCGHEYTQKNAEYAHEALPDHDPITERLEKVEVAREAGEPTIPTTMGLEKTTNPFLLADDPAIASALGMSGEPPEEVFALLRKGRDAF